MALVHTTGTLCFRREAQALVLTLRIANLRRHCVSKKKKYYTAIRRRDVTNINISIAPASARRFYRNGP